MLTLLILAIAASTSCSAVVVNSANSNMSTVYQAECPLSVVEALAETKSIPVVVAKKFHVKSKKVVRRVHKYQRVHNHRACNRRWYVNAAGRRKYRCRR